MHEGFVNPMDMKVEHQYGLHHDQDFGTGRIEELGHEQSSPPTSSPQNEYESFTFQAPAETTFIRPFEPSFSAPQSLHPLNTSEATLWPSQITNPSEHSSPPMSLPILRSSEPLAPSVPASSPVSQAPAPARAAPVLPTSRRTLSDDDRRRMCKYHDENPSVKQTEIGAMFGVERSTVSKVLRNKEKYLVPEDGSRSPVKRSKSKFPDIERTLLNWVKNRVSEGLPVTDDLIKDEARKFASTLGNAESHSIVNDPIWLEKFKQKNSLPGAKARESKPDKDGQSPHSKSGSQTPNGISPTLNWDGIPVHPLKDEYTKSPDSYYDSSASAWSHAHSQSTASMGSCYSDVTIASSFTDFRSPTSPFFSPMSSCGPSPAMPAQKTARLPPLAPAGSLRRRQTVPLVGAEVSPDSATSKNPLSATLESPIEEMEMSSINNDHHTRSLSGIHTPVTTHSSLQVMGPPPPVSTNVSPTAPPSRDEARSALQTLMDYIRRCPDGMIDPHDYIVMGKLMQMLRLDGDDLPGGMHSILMTERVTMPERADGTVPIGRKRSEHSLS